MMSLFIFFASLFVTIKAAMGEIGQYLKDVYAKWDNQEKPIFLSTEKENCKDEKVVHRNEKENPKQEISEVSTKRTASNLHMRQNIRSVTFDLPKLNGLAQFKMSPTVLLENTCPRPFVGRCCPKCLPISSLTSMSNNSTLLSISNILDVPTQNRGNNLLVRIFHHVSFVLQRRHCFTYSDSSENVLNHGRVQKAIEKAARDEKDEEELSEVELSVLYYKHRLRAKQILMQMKSAISTFLLKVSGWVMFKLLNRMLKSIQIHKGQIENLKHISKNNTPIIYLPLHRSHLDYILLTFILYMNDLRIPLVAAGDNLMIPFFGNLLRNLGAFFIKRKLDLRNGKKDFVYRSILHTYMAESLREGHSIEFFIEGGRSRTGKSCLPKAGLLSVVIDSLVDGCIEDAYIVPVAISYEKILDGNFILEQLGRSKVMESFSTALRSIWKVLHSNYGSVRVDFCQPFSLKEFMHASKHFNGSSSPKLNVGLNPVSSFNKIRPSSSNSSLYGTDIVVDDMRQVIRDVADHIVYDASNATALMSTNVLSFLFLTKHRKGATLNQLVQSLNWLKEEIINRKRDVGYSGNSADVIKHACNLLGKDLVTTETIEMEWSSFDMPNNNVKIYFFKPVIRLPYVLELQYYSNSLLSIFLLDSIVVNALFALLDEEIEQWRGCESKLIVFREKLVSKSLELCDILQYEFIFTPPCTCLTVLLNETIDRMVTSELLRSKGMVGYGIDTKTERAWVNRSVTTLEWNESSDDDDELPLRDEQLQVCLTEECINMLQFYRCILSPYIESYWLAACSLTKLINTQKEEKLFFEDMQKTAQDRLHRGLLSYEESFAAEPLRNAQRLFEHWKVVETHRQDSIKIIYLHCDYDNEESVSDVIGRIEEFRR
ncbi:glycerol-3-phosphate acyltransferase 1, mitochondrial-like isoform X1 [Centruroides vittatus]|uniref:glycerol-3-phosphate acyltransferase 1, mitochondrial-like isoform X1 n=2 Tax=Centruroides vittatus TaxID=120091 RepID=UPI00350F14D0